MTVCTAGIHQDDHSGGSSIVLVCDRRISIFGGMFSQDGTAKYRPIHRDWVCMFAGGVEETTILTQKVSESLKQLVAAPFDDVVDTCRTAYSKARIRLIETQILPDYDISNYRAFQRLKRTNEALYLNIEDKIKESQDAWNLLFAGFDVNRVPHVFVISGSGIVEYHESQKHAAIGSGAFAALVWLSFYGWHHRHRLGQVLFGLMSAKFFAERAQDVGQPTVVSVVNAKINGFFHLNDDEIAKARTSWERLPKYSEVTVQELEKNILQVENAASIYFTQLVSKRSKQEK